MAMTRGSVLIAVRFVRLVRLVGRAMSAVPASAVTTMPTVTEHVHGHEQDADNHPEPVFR